MGLNIKNERVCALAKQAAAITGRTQTSVIELALERLLAEHETANTANAQAKAQRIDAIIQDLQRAWADTDSHRLPTEGDLYDENGLPA
ncbi:hypothetical protein GOEFS_045_00070 [Gordonia effusa NBRC 100432]|uniref:Antitoxin VapB n=1 Tax=Gordonia effusa NBRC 100432 TaxID=1077974 RepID=H0QYW6_9ACTN|nr:type II toxin-antitoxin system VapB family antitoxin [Gordonia effusa]GAB18017.1 hypothetical protein GOEFS_045_00070 [Gordonia effusa NBRC 100432]